MKSNTFKEFLDSDFRENSLRRWINGEAKLDLIKHVNSNLVISKSQLQQDLLAIWITDPTNENFFVEFGAADGLEWSNTKVLEDLGWNGICAEPSKEFRHRLVENRGCKLDFRAVHQISGQELDFLDVGVLGTLIDYAFLDEHSSARKQSKNLYRVETVSLVDLLEFHSAPQHINFISIDTEGSEFDILKEFDFEKYTFDFLAIEHNHTGSESKIEQLLMSKGYVRVLRETSDFDCWFLNAKLAHKV